MAFYVVADSPVGRELFITDGTRAGTRALDIAGFGARLDSYLSNPGSISRDTRGRDDAGAVIGDRFVFGADAFDGLGAELYVSNGTRAGTRLLVDLVPGERGSAPLHFQPVEGGALFTAQTPEQGRELWFTDATAQGTRLVRDIVPGETSGIRDVTRDERSIVQFDVVWAEETANGIQYFEIADTEAGTALWRTDATTAGTARVRGLVPSFLADPDSPSVAADIEFNAAQLALGDRLLFTAGTEGQRNALWSTDGGAPVLLSAFGDTPAAVPGAFVEVGGEGYFATNDTDGDGRGEIWRTDGTPGGTAIFAELAPGANRASEIEAFAGDLWFRSRAATGPDRGFELYRLDLDTREIALFLDLDSTESGSPRDLAAIGDRLYFSANTDGAFREPWVTDGTPAGTMMLGDLNATTGSADPDEGGYGFTVIGGRVYFVARTESRDRLWVTDGTPEGTDLAVSFVVPTGRVIGGDDIAIFEPAVSVALDPALAPDGARLVAYLYEAALDRDGEIDLTGLNFWIDAREDGRSAEAIANDFLESDEFRTLLGNATRPDASGFLDDLALVTGLYENVLDRAADQPGLDFWLSVAQEQDISRADLLIFFAESAENRAASPEIQTLSELSPGFWAFG